MDALKAPCLLNNMMNWYFSFDVILPFLDLRISSSLFVEQHDATHFIPGVFGFAHFTFEV